MTSKGGPMKKYEIAAIIAGVAIWTGVGCFLACMKAEEYISDLIGLEKFSSSLAKKSQN